MRPKIVDLLALGVIESVRTRSQITPAVWEVLQKAAGAPNWYSPGRVPRVYSALLNPASVAPRREHLIDLAKAMRAYAPDRLILTADGLVKPARAALRPVPCAAVA